MTLPGSGSARLHARRQHAEKIHEDWAVPEVTVTAAGHGAGRVPALVAGRCWWASSCAAASTWSRTTSATRAGTASRRRDGQATRRGAQRVALRSRTRARGHDRRCGGVDRRASAGVGPPTFFGHSIGPDGVRPSALQLHHPRQVPEQVAFLRLAPSDVEQPSSGALRSPWNGRPARPARVPRRRRSGGHRAGRRRRRRDRLATCPPTAGRGTAGSPRATRSAASADAAAQSRQAAPRNGMAAGCPGPRPGARTARRGGPAAAPGRCLAHRREYQASPGSYNPSQHPALPDRRRVPAVGGGVPGRWPTSSPRRRFGDRNGLRSAC